MCFLALACESPTEPEGLYTPDVRPYVSGAAAALLDNEGHFLLNEPVSPAPYEMISRSFAGDLAQAYFSTFLFPGTTTCLSQCIGAFIEERRGARIDFSVVRPGSRVFFAESPYVPVDDTIPMPTRREAGPQYLIHLLEKGLPVGSLAVAAFNTDVTVVEGKLRFPLFSGANFFASGIPIGSLDHRPCSPEAVVETFAKGAGVKITEVPELLLPRRPIVALDARWKLTLEHSVTFRSASGALRESSVVYVRGNQLFLPQTVQPALDTVAYRRPEGDRALLLEVRFRSGIPVHFEQVTMR